MSSNKRSKDVHGAVSVTFKKLSAKRYKRAVGVDPRLSRCYSCREEMTTPPKAICITMPLDSSTGCDTQNWVVFACERCAHFKVEIARAYVSRNFFNTNGNRKLMGGLL